jgi:hypothetical protein
MTKARFSVTRGLGTAGLLLVAAMACDGGTSHGGDESTGTSGSSGAGRAAVAGGEAGTGALTGGEPASGGLAGGGDAGGVAGGGTQTGGVAGRGGEAAGGLAGGGGGAGGAAGGGQQTGGVAGRGGEAVGGLAGGGGGAGGIAGAQTGGGAGGGGEAAGGAGGDASGGGVSPGTGGVPEGGSAGAGGQIPVVVTPVDGVEVTTLTGSGTSGLVDGTLSDASFHNPVNVAVGGRIVYVTDFDNAAIRVIDLDGGTVGTRYQNAAFCRPFGLAVGGPDELYVGTDCGPKTAGIPTHTDGAIWRLALSGTGAPELMLEVNGRARGIVYLGPNSTHAQGSLVFSDWNGHTVNLFDIATRSVAPLAGLSGTPGYANGSGTAARFNRPYGIVVLAGDLVVADWTNHALRRVTLDGSVTTLAGTGNPGMVDGPVDSAMFSYPEDVAADAQGNLYVSDKGNQRIRVVHNGEVRTLAGTGQASYADGPGATAAFFGQEGLDVSADGTSVYVADGDNGASAPYHRIRLVTVPSLD